MILGLSLPMKDASYSLRPLFELVARLRSPEGCPWDREQKLENLRAYLVEEAHEVAAAIDQADWQDIGSELGDLLFQVVFVACLAQEAAAFTFADVVDRIEAKMIARHPHVFGDEVLADSTSVHQAWERRKLENAAPGTSLLEGVPTSLPSLLAAYRMTQKAAGVGFDWPDATAVLDKVDEELAELRAELAEPTNPESKAAIEMELGDLIFTLANLARHLGLDPEATLAGANAKFRRRFRRMENELVRRGLTLTELDLEVMEDAWIAAKRAERE